VVAPFYAGFLVAWTLIYVSAACYCAWATRRPRSEPGTAQLAALFAFLAITSGAMAGALVLEPDASDFMLRLSHAAVMPTPIILVHFARAEGSDITKRRALLGAYAGSAILAAIALTGAFDGSPMTPHAFEASTRAGKLAAIILTSAVFVAAYALGRAIPRSKSIGAGPFVGACLLSGTAVYDAITAVAGAGRPALLPAGFAAFTLALFIDLILRLARRREHLIEKTAELSRRSRTLTKSFRELRAKKDELVRKEQLAAIGELSAVIAHEVRNPLAIMSNAVATLRRANVDEEARETLLGILSEEGARLNQLVGDLLHYAKPLAIERQSVSLMELVKKALGQASDKPNIVVRVSQGEHVPSIGGDPLLLRQAIDNLVNNALQAMGNGGTLAVELHASSSGTRGAELVLRDTGEGMDTVVRKRALDPFFTTRPSGTGLGLAIVARVIDAHGGELTIRSERGAGTEVRVFLPCDEETVRARTPRRITQPVIEPFPADDGSRKREAS